MISNSFFCLILLISFLVNPSWGAVKCLTLMHPLNSAQVRWIQHEIARSRIVSDFYESVRTFQSRNSKITGAMLDQGIISFLEKFEVNPGGGATLQKGPAKTFSQIHQNRIPTTNYKGEQYQVRLLRNEDTAFFIYVMKSDPSSEVVAVRGFKLRSRQWQMLGDLEFKTWSSILLKMLDRETAQAYTRFFASSGPAVTSFFSLLSQATSKDFSVLSHWGAIVAEQSRTMAANLLTHLEFRKNLVELIQHLGVSKKRLSKVAGDNNQDFRVLTGSVLQASKEYSMYSIARSQTVANHEYFMAEATGAKRLLLVDLTLGRTKGEIRAMRQEAKDLAFVEMHLDPNDQPLGEIDAFDTILDYVYFLHRELIVNKE